MGLVLAFETAPRRASARPAVKRSEPPKSAEVLFFTGVRYERHGEVCDPRPAAQRPDATPPSS